MKKISACASLAVALIVAASAGADWPTWRGPQSNGISDEKGLVSNWSPDGTNLLWRSDFTGRSTPVVIGDRVCATGRIGEGITRQETAACFDVDTGEKLWQQSFNVYHTTVPWNRVGWANPTADPETGYLYVQGVGGLFFCFDSEDGSIVWSRNLVEDFGFMEGYGGRTQTPTIDEDRVIVSFANLSWGSEAKPVHRYHAFDKRTGELVWASAPADYMADKNTQSTPQIAVIDGQRLMIAGNGNGWIYAVQSRTGEPVWGFHLSKRGINTTVVVDGKTVYAAHSEENVDEPTMGRVVAFDASGNGDITESAEIWRSPLGAGYASPLKVGDRVYVVDNSGDLHALDAASGEELWEHNLGTVGKGSPAFGDGKLYVTEVNGHFVIVEPGAEGATTLDKDQLTMPGEERYAEVYGSPAIADGRIFFTTEEGIYAVAAKEPAGGAARAGTVDDQGGRRPGGPADPAMSKEAPVAAGAPVAKMLVIPGEIELRPGQKVDFRVEGFTAFGQSLGKVEGATLGLGQLEGSIDGRSFTPAADERYQAGYVVAKLGDVEARARVRVIADLPMTEDFESYEVGSRPVYLKTAGIRFEVAEKDGSKVLLKGPSPAKLHRHHTLIGHPDMAGYTIQSDVMTTRTGRRIGDVGLINTGYVIDLQGIAKKVQLRSWAAELRMATEVDFPVEIDKWYTVKLRVDQRPDSALVRGKVWPKGEAEPEEWTITQEDPRPIRKGSPGLIAYSPSPVYWDNLSVIPTESVAPTGP